MLNLSNGKPTIFILFFSFFFFFFFFFSFFHPISKGHYLFSHSLFHIRNSSQWLSIFLSELVSLWTKFIFYFLNWIGSYSSLKYIYFEWVTLWHSVMHKLYKRCYKKFNYEWKIMTLNPKKGKVCVMRLIIIISLLIVLKSCQLLCWMRVFDRDYTLFTSNSKWFP